jgi:hypothetical protein
LLIDRSAEGTVIVVVTVVDYCWTGVGIGKARQARVTVAVLVN